MITPRFVSPDEQELAAGYVLGDLSPQEQRAFEQLLQQHPALQAEVQALQKSYSLVPHAVPVMPPPTDLAERILRANADIALGRSPLPLAERSAAPRPQSSAPVRSAPIRSTPARSAPVPQRTRSGSFPWRPVAAGIAAGGLLLLLGADNLRLRQALNQANQTIETAKAQADQAGPAIALLQRPNSRLIRLEAADQAPAAGTVLFTPGQWQQVVVSIQNLPPLPPDQVYRMWLQLNTGQTLPCGEFIVPASGSAPVFVTLRAAQNPPPDAKATGVFITTALVDAPLEPEGEPLLSGEI